ncbi:MAG: DUF255 domain-containing protein [Chthoniobacter sp.]
MSVFLTPELKPFYGGTYFPPEDRYGRPGFPTILQRLAEAWKNEPEKVLGAANDAIRALGEYSASGPAQSAAAGKEAITLTLNQLTRTFDDDLGGFGGAPKFPRPVTLNFLFRVAARESHDSRDGKAALGMALLTLQKMADGGMHDHLGGGFHRYSVDQFWHVPHFEKMLYDQAQLASAYLDAFQITHDPLYEKTARDIFDYVRRDMTDPAGGFYSAEDADSLLEKGKPEHAEGAFYVWTKDEIVHALGEETASLSVASMVSSPRAMRPRAAIRRVNFTARISSSSASPSRMPPGSSRQNESDLSASLAAARGKLLALRDQRPRPHLDDKIITSWNGLMISAFARGAQILDDPAYLASAQKAAHFIREHLWKDGQLLRSYRQGAGEVGGFCDDYAALIQGLLDLYEADFDIAWLQWAVELQAKQDSLFLDAEHGGYFSVTKDAPNILLRMKEDYDGAEPSPNSVAALNLLRLAQITGQDDYARQARAHARRLCRSAFPRSHRLAADARRARLLAGQTAPGRHRRFARVRRDARLAPRGPRTLHPR